MHVPHLVLFLRIAGIATWVLALVFAVGRVAARRSERERAWRAATAATLVLCAAGFAAQLALGALTGSAAALRGAALAVLIIALVLLSARHRGV